MAPLPKRPRIDVQLFTLEKVESVLQEAAEPVSRQWILDHLRAEDAGTTRQRLNRALDYLFRHGMAIEGPKGVQWTHSGSISLQRARLLGRRLA